MRLQTRTNILYAGLSLILVVIGGLLYFYLMRGIVREEIDERLEVRKQRIEKRIAEGMIDFSDEIITQISPVQGAAAITESLTDTLIFDDYDAEYIPYRQLTFPVASGNTVYRVVLRQSLIESEDILESVQISMFIILVVLLSGLWLLNRLVATRLWAPFHATLRRLGEHGFLSDKVLELPETGITEFRELNDTIGMIARRNQREMQRLKEFTENASHEMQTPLAIILSELEGLLEDSELDERRLGSISAASKAAAKLTTLNKTLLLLTRIEGPEYLQRDDVDVTHEVESILDVYSELITSKELTLQKSYSAALRYHMNRTLARILISNLIKNAIVHADRGGVIRILVTESTLVVENTGRSLRCDPELLFQRFRKDDQTYPSLGLGLSIVRSICDMNDLTVTYVHEGLLHTLIVTFCF